MKVNFPAETIKRQVRSVDTIQVAGKVTQVVGTVIEGHCPDASIGRLFPAYARDRALKLARRALGESGYRRVRKLGLGS